MSVYLKCFENYEHIRYDMQYFDVPKFHRLKKTQNLVKTVANVLNILDPFQDLEDEDMEELGMNAFFAKFISD